METTVTNSSGKIDITVPNAVAISTAPSAPAEETFGGIMTLVIWQCIMKMLILISGFLSGAVGAQGPQGSAGAASTTGYPGTEWQLLQHDGTSFVGIASTGFRDYVINHGQGYYAYTTDYYTVGTANTTQEIAEENGHFFNHK